MLSAFLFDITVDPGQSIYHYGYLGIITSSVISLFVLFLFKRLESFNIIFKPMILIGNYSIIAYGSHMCEQPVYPVKVILSILEEMHINECIGWIMIFVSKVCLAYLIVLLYKKVKMLTINRGFLKR